MSAVHERVLKKKVAWTWFEQKFNSLRYDIDIEVATKFHTILGRRALISDFDI